LVFGFYRRVACALRISAIFGASLFAGPLASEVKYDVLSFDQLEGWAQDDHAAALSTFLNTCKDMKGADWKAVCAYAQSGPDPREFFELLFRPVVMDDGKEALFTGYFQPELEGSLTKTSRYRFPVYKMPPEARQNRPWLTRREILESGVMDGRGLAIAYVDDSVELFFLQIQGSGRIRLAQGGTLRVGYRGSNGHNYRSIGQELVRQGVYQPHQVSAEVIKNWVRRNPEAGQKLLYNNDSYVFFREVSQVPSDKGPLGAMNRSITTMRTVAVDPSFVRLGSPVWIEKDGKEPLRRLMIAQDTGSAIKGAQRADVFLEQGMKRVAKRGHSAILADWSC
jgi:membrane-bound lytic murein transglycosylase A